MIVSVQFRLFKYIKETDMSEFKLNVPAYLERIGIHEVPAPTGENLKMLTRAHLESVPFENLEAHLQRRVPSLSADDLYRKVVENRRGGWCFELNKLFCLLLTELGYSCRSAACRVVYNRPELRPVSHRATLVETGGHLWFCDVGFGNNGPRGPLRVDTAEPQTVFGTTFRVQPDRDRYPGELIISVLEEGSWQPVLTLRDHAPWNDADYAQLNTLYSIDPDSFFQANMVVFRCTPVGKISLMKNHLIRQENGRLQEADLTRAQVDQVLKEDFGLHIKINE